MTMHQEQARGEEGGWRLLAIVPARGGSQGIPRKNIKPFLGKPLVAWTIEAALASKVCTRVIVSTEDQAIARISHACGAEVPFLRPQELAQDTTPTAPVVRHVIEWLRDHEGWIPQAVMVLEPTSPGRRAFHIREAAALLQQEGVDSVASISALPHHYVPPKVLAIQRDGTIAGLDGTHPRQMIHRRQDLPTYYTFNGLIFACKTAWVLRDPATLWGEHVLGYVVDPRYALDLDSPEEWVSAEARLPQMVSEERLMGQPERVRG